MTAHFTRMETLKETIHSRISFSGRTDNPRLAITFNHYGSNSMQKPGFGVPLLTTNGFDVVTVQCERNYWFQDISIDDFKEAVLPVASNYQNVSLYGISMAGYAALYFSRAVPASRVLSISPQVSIDPRYVPWEHRWLRESKGIKFTHDPIENHISETAEKFILYDPANLDARHIAHLKSLRIPSTNYVPIYFGGHSVAPPLLEMGVLKKIALGILSETLDASALRQSIRENRTLSPRLMINLMHYRYDRAKTIDNRLLARVNSMTLGADNCYELAKLMARAGRLDDAVEFAKRSKDIDSRNPHYWAEFSNALQRKNQMQEALDAINSGIDAAKVAIERKETTPKQTAYLHKTCSNLCERLGQIDGAITAMFDAVSANPDDKGYRKTLYDLMETSENHIVVHQVLSKLASKNFKDGSLYLKLYKANIAIGNEDEAFWMVQLACHFTPENPHAHATLANMLIAKNRLDDALSSIRRAIAARPDIAYLHKTHAVILSRIGQQENALSSIRRAITLDPANTHFQEILERVRKKMPGAQWK
ncbi:tetratricopeptide repeat protein [Ponticoccus alexandrii]|uniref:Tetratricopeptide repeat protein n=1 Tax=Ponticoccus alexandrii TaxID=1943633 RepID=A0ABX7FFI2_9RHOB|nr:hypothetical protein [Ponticoccus alexandrii]QRF68686.1 hypothetical protein GQA70_20120 [Ponticoccus alexandrii]